MAQSGQNLTPSSPNADAFPIADTPDQHAHGLLKHGPDPLRYDDPPESPDETPSLLRSLIPKGARVLDIGCGTGSLTIAVTSGVASHVVAIEPDPHRAERARSRGLEVICGTADRELLSKLGPFDVIILADVLEHLADPAELLTTLSDVLKHGGSILASVPNVAHWTVRLRLLLGSITRRLALWTPRTSAGSRPIR